MIRRAHFRVAGRTFNGARSATVTITSGGDHALMTVRPFRRRRGYELPLASVAAWVIERCVRDEIAAKRAAKRKGRT